FLLAAHRNLLHDSQGFADRAPIGPRSTDLNTPSLENLEIGAMLRKRTSVGCKKPKLRTAVPALPKQWISSRRDLVRKPAFPGLASTKPAVLTASRRCRSFAASLSG